MATLTSTKGKLKLTTRNEEEEKDKIVSQKGKLSLTKLTTQETKKEEAATKRVAATPTAADVRAVGQSIIDRGGIQNVMKDDETTQSTGGTLRDLLQAQQKESDARSRALAAMDEEYKAASHGMTQGFLNNLSRNTQTAVAEYQTARAELEQAKAEARLQSRAEQAKAEAESQMAMLIAADEQRKPQSMVENMRRQAQDTKDYDWSGTDAWHVAPYLLGEVLHGATGQVWNLGTGLTQSLGDLLSRGRASDELGKVQSYFDENPQAYREFKAVAIHYPEARSAVMAGIAKNAGLSTSALENYRQANLAQIERENMQNTFDVSEGVREAFGNMAYQVGQQVPAMMLTAGGGSSALVNNVARSLMGMSSYGAKLQENAEKNGFDWGNYANAAATGLVESMTEAIGSTPTLQSIAKLSLAENSVGEMMEELIGYPLEQVSDWIFLKDGARSGQKFDEIFDAGEWIKAGMSGAVLGGLLGSVGSVANIAGRTMDGKISTRQAAAELNRVTATLPDGTTIGTLDPRVATEEDLRRYSERIVDSVVAQAERAYAAPKMGSELASEMGIGKNGAQTAQELRITPENVGAFTANYEAGKNGKAFEEVRTVQTGIDENMARQAFNAGQMDAIAEGTAEQEVTENAEERNESGREGSGWQIGMAAAERSGGIPEGTGSAAERRETQRLRAEEIRNSVHAAGQVNTSAAAQGIAEGTSKQSFKLVPAKLWTNEVRTAVHDLSAKGIQGIPIVGELELVDQNGPYMARAAVSRDGKRVWFSLDDPDVEFERLIEHEEYHVASIKDPGLVEKTRQAVLDRYDEETLAKVVELYVDTYGWGNLSKEYILGEIFGDANGAINEFEDYNLAGATLFTDVVRNVVRNADMQSAATADSAKTKFKGYDAKTGKGIYESNFPKGTPKAAKAQRILDYIQNVWSKNPIRLVVEKPGEAPREIIAQFDPTYDQGQNVPTDASKLMGGNRHGNASEQRVTLDLADDYYQIASESGYNGFKEETGKDSLTHNNVKEWHYFVNDILFQEYGETETAPYRVTINVKERSDGSFVYSFNAEREDKRPSTRRTLHADVNQTATSGEANAQPSTDIVDQGGENVNTQTSRAPSKAQLEKAVAQYIEKYGAIEPGENPAREIQVPRKTSENENVSKTVRTVLEAKATPEAAVPTIEQMVANGDFSYETITDKAALAQANSKLQNKGWARTLSDWLGEAKKGTVSKDHTVTGWALYNNAANAKDLDTAMTVLEEMVKSQRNAAQALQATRVLKKMSPEAQLYGAQRSIENLQEELNERYGKKDAPEIRIDPALAEEFLAAKTEKARADAMANIYKDVGKQMPSTFQDKWNAWRYLAMLGNPRTHVRNIVGNAGFAPVVAAKNLTATAIEKAVNVVSGGKTGRSKAVLSVKDADLLKAAWADFENVQDQIMAGGKYSDFQMAQSAIEEGRRIFKNRLLEGARRGNSAALEAEDVWFSKPHYATALASYCKANKISPETIAEGTAIETARAYAIREAQKATYRDTNAFSQMISDLGKVDKNEKNLAKKGVGLVLQGILPFRKTPANILVRGVEYSPIGLLKSITVDSKKVAKGEMSATDLIDNISAGLTGTGLLAMGAFLAAQGLVRGHGPEDKEKEFEEMQGHQAYSLEVGGKSYTLDWLAPECLPFFVGVNLYEQSVAQREDITMSEILSAITNVSEPMLEMSCLQSLNDVFDAVGYASSNDLSALPSILASAATSYLTQAIPTILGQAERTGQDVRYSTYTTKDAFLTRDMQYAIGSATARIPGIDYNQVPYIDAWGRQESTGTVAERAAGNFLNPSYTSNIEESAMEKELLRVYGETGEASVFPTRAQRSFPVNGETKYLTADEYVKYATSKGQTSYDLVEDLVNMSQYKAMSEEEKASAISDAYALANVVAKYEVSDYTTDGWMAKAVEAKKIGIDYSKYLEVRLSVKDIESIKDADGDSIANSKGLLVMEAIYNINGLNDKQRRRLFEDFGVGKSVINLNKAAVQAKLKGMR